MNIIHAEITGNSAAILYKLLSPDCGLCSLLSCMSQSISSGGFAETERKTTNCRPPEMTRLSPYFLTYDGRSAKLFSSVATALAPCRIRLKALSYLAETGTLRLQPQDYALLNERTFKIRHCAGAGEHQPPRWGARFLRLRGLYFDEYRSR